VSLGHRAGQHRWAVLSGSCSKAESTMRLPMGSIGGRSTLVAVVSHFLELETELEVLGSRRSVGVTEGEADVLWT
jgi:hypothetical protein